MGKKLSKIPFDLEFIGNFCSNCNGHIEFKKRTVRIGINYIEDCGGCISCLRNKGCGGYEKFEEKEVNIPICNICNVCLKCKKGIFNINDKYQDYQFCKKDGSYFHKECYNEYTKPNDPKRHYELVGLGNTEWRLKGLYTKCKECKQQYVIPIDDKPINKDDARTKVVEIYQKCNPQKLEDVDDLLNKYIEREGELVARLKNKYAPQLLVRAYVIDIYLNYGTPEELGKVDALISKYEGQEAVLITELHKKYDGCDRDYTNVIDAVKYPNMCSECIQKKNFQNEWKKLTPQEKLDKHGVAKLKKLAKQKNIKGYSRWSRPELLEKLKPLVKHADFPIK